MSRKSAITRRQFLRSGLAAAALAQTAPFWLRQALADPSQSTRAEGLISIILGHGAFPPEDFFSPPQLSSLQTVPLPYQTAGEAPAHVARWAPLASLKRPPGTGENSSGPIGGTPGVPRYSLALDPFPESIINETQVIYGIDLPSSFGHHSATLGTPSVVGGARVGTPAASFDFMAAQLPGLYTNRNLANRLTIVGGGASNTFGHPMPQTEHRPLPASPASGGANIQTLFQALYRRPAGSPNMLDHLLSKLGNLSSSPKLGSLDRRQVELLRFGFNEIRSKFAGLEHAATLAGCESNFSSSGLAALNPAYMNLPTSAGYTSNQAYWSNLVRLMAMAIQCGLTRVITDSETHFGIFDPNSTPGVNDYHQHIVHALPNDPATASAAEGSPRHVHAQNLRRLMNDTVVPLAQELEARNLLSRTIILVTFESGYPAHTSLNIPHLVIGGSALGMRGGRYIDLRNHDNPINLNRWGTPRIEYPGVSKNWLFATLGHALGMNRADDTREGVTGFISRPIPFNYLTTRTQFQSHATDMREHARLLLGLMI